MTTTSMAQHTQNMLDATEYELLRILENSSDEPLLTAALRERDNRFKTRYHTRDFWNNTFFQETRKLRDNMGGDFVTVSKGSYVLGDQYRTHAYVKRYELEEAFAIGRFPVAEGEFKRFVDDGGYQKREYWDNYSWRWKESLSLTGPWLWIRYPFEKSRTRFPMTGVSYFEASAFCRWRTSIDSVYETVRLATSPEWEIAARGRLARPYPWGWSKDTVRCNVDTHSRSASNRYPGGVSPVGCWDMLGNVHELTATPRPDSKRLKEMGEQLSALPNNPMIGPHVGVWALCMAPVHLRMRGGSHLLGWSDANTYKERYVRPDDRVPDLGFRLVCTPALDL